MTKSIQYKLELGTSGIHQTIVIVTERVGNTVNGAPVYLSTILMVNREGFGEQYTPEGMSRRKDMRVRTETYAGYNEVFRIIQNRLEELHQ